MRHPPRERSTSHQTCLLKAVVAGLCDNDVIQHSDSENARGLRQLLVKREIGVARLRVAGRIAGMGLPSFQRVLVFGLCVTVAFCYERRGDELHVLIAGMGAAMGCRRADA